MQMSTIDQYNVTPPPDLPPPDPLIGTVIAEKYELLRLLGQGGMGAVYEGRNASTLKRCAVKVLVSAEMASSGEAVKRFFREARASSVLESDHIVQIFDSGSDPKTGFPYMVMELLNGQDLEQRCSGRRDDRREELHSLIVPIPGGSRRRDTGCSQERLGAFGGERKLWSLSCHRTPRCDFDASPLSIPAGCRAVATR